MNNIIQIFSDAGSFNNGRKDPEKPMYGSFGTIIVKDNQILYEYKDWYEDVTNNQMELFGCIYGIMKFFSKYKTNNSYTIQCISDSQYLINGMNKYLINWKKKNWKNSTGEIVKNLDLWLILDKLINIYQKNIKFEFIWQKGHEGKKITLDEDPLIYFNEVCDSLATGQIDYAISESNSMLCPVNEFEMKITSIKKQLKIN